MFRAEEMVRTERYRSWATTHLGVVRKHNEDAYVNRPEIGLWAVADGAGGSSGQVVGMLTLAVFMLPTGVRAWIEDVVVDDTWRGGGVASTLIEAAIDRADAAGARTVDLTSRPHREAANRLYLRLGFERRETNAYRRTLEVPI